MLDETHDPSAASWVGSANTIDTDFPLQNLPHGVFRRAGSAETFRGGVAIGDSILDLVAVSACGGLGELTARPLAAAAEGRLNSLMSLGTQACRALRLALFQALRAGSRDENRLAPCLLPQSAAEYDLPATIGDYTDFYTSLHHAYRVGAMLRPHSPLMPNYKWIPIGYHGRTSSIGVSGHAFRRPCGQARAADASAPQFGPSARLDYELELGFFVGPANHPGDPIPVATAEDHIFGACLLNDWSARDIQAWEYQPLGPFLGKNFATTISPWIVTMAALAPFRAPFQRSVSDPAPLPYLDLGAKAATAGIDIQLEAYLQTPDMRAADLPAHRLSRSSYRHAFWTPAQMVAHHASNGCNLRPGDLIGTGTISGPEAGELGSIVEITEGGTRPIQLANGETRRFIADGDSITLRGWCERPGARRVGFGSCTGRVLPSHQAG